jgi:hypothetical protein
MANSRRIALLLFSLLLVCSATLVAQTTPSVSVGAGLQTSFAHTDTKSVASTDNFLINSARIYLNGTAAEKVKFMFNTEYDGGTNKVGVLDAVARYESSPGFNIWMGRFLPPSDRANLYGPYYAHHWATFSDGVQDGYPFLSAGRDNGIAYWGDYGKLKLSAGAFDGPTTTGRAKVLVAARAQYNFWDTESGYYLNGTYYGGKNLLAIGGAVQNQSSNTATTLDFLLERKLSSMGVVTVESEFSYYDRLGGYNSRYGLSRGAYILGSYLFPQKIGNGQIEVLGKFAEASFAKGITANDPYYKQKTSEANVNYVIKEFNARVMTFYKNTRFTAVNPNSWQLGLGFQIQM